MERQYIFFKSARGLLVFAVGVTAIVACTKILYVLFPEAPGFLAAIVATLTAIVIIVSFKADARHRYRSKNETGEPENR